MRRNPTVRGLLAFALTSWKSSAQHAEAFPIYPNPIQAGCPTNGDIAFSFVNPPAPFGAWTADEKAAVVAGFQKWEPVKDASGTTMLQSYGPGVTPPVGTQVWTVTFEDLPGFAGQMWCGTKKIAIDQFYIRSDRPDQIDDTAFHERGHAAGPYHSAQFESVGDPNAAHDPMGGVHPYTLASDSIAQAGQRLDPLLVNSANANAGFETLPSTNGIPRSWYLVGGTMSSAQTGCYQGVRCVDYVGTGDSSQGFKSWASLADVSYPNPDSIDGKFNFRSPQAGASGYVYGWLSVRDIGFGPYGTNWPYGRLQGKSMAQRLFQGPLVQVSSYKGAVGGDSNWHTADLPNYLPPATFQTPGTTYIQSLDAQLRVWSTNVSSGTQVATQFDDAEVRWFD